MTLIALTNLCYDMVFTGTMGHSRPEEEEMDFAGIEFINWQYVGPKLCQSSCDWSARLQGAVSFLLDLIQFPHIAMDPYLCCWNWGEHLGSHVPILKALDRNPACPCCGNQTGSISGLVEHPKTKHKNLAGLSLESSISVGGHCPHICKFRGLLYYLFWL